MTGKLQIPMVSSEIVQDERQEFIQAIHTGLSKNNKQISSKFFYDKRGSELFNLITRHPDYYLTNCELEILTACKQELAQLFNKEKFNLVELGPGEGIKTRLLLNQFYKNNLSFNYYPIDISKKFLNQLINKLDKELPDLETIALNTDYLNGIKWLSNNSSSHNLVLFLGSSIGNFTAASAKEFLNLLHKFLRAGDYLLIGFDLLKDIELLMRAYNDNDGITRAFNLNLLTRMNRELGANFDLHAFQHYGMYNPSHQAMESYLISNKEQIVYFEALEKSFGFKKYEAIHVESSQKYLLPQIEQFAKTAQFKLISNFIDKQRFFIDSLWSV